MSLGSIAHLQYYFARTGLLDGKGAQLARESKKKPQIFEGPLSHTPSSCASPEVSVLGDDHFDSPVEEEDLGQSWDGSMMLPPTVSTYNHRVRYLPPPPDSENLRSNLKKALLEAEKAIGDVRIQIQQSLDRRESSNDKQNEDEREEEEKSQLSAMSSGWHEIQGLHILDVITFAIRAAKLYYTTHENPQRLYSIKSERQIREGLLCVMDCLKRLAGRNFAGGIRPDELTIIEDWVKGIKSFLVEEQATERRELQAREGWEWLNGSWEGREREREWMFMSSFLCEGSLPQWTVTDQPGPCSSAFLQTLSDGLILVTLQNSMLKKSKRQFGEIKTFHTDTAKPYRCAENLRYWIKSTEIRWETKLKVDVTGVVHQREEAMAGFDAAIMRWSTAAREGLTREWNESPHQRTVTEWKP